MMASRMRLRNGLTSTPIVDQSGQVLVAKMVARWYNCVFNVKGE